MKRGIPNRGAASRWGVLLALVLCPMPVLAQVNSWLKPTSGNWEENQWSLGVLPGPGQSIMITNAGWKAVTIASTTQNYPNSMAVESITLQSPPDSQNVLLFNYPGQAIPLSTRFFTVASNTAVTMYNGALNLTGGNGEGMSVGGEFHQEASSTVLGSQMDIGYIGPGVYHLLSGNIWLQHIWVGGGFAGKMIQTGGTNGANILHLDPGGEYTLVDGDFNVVQVYFGTVFSGPSLLRQQGGRINTGLGVYHGTYLLEGGWVSGEITVPISDGFSSTGNGTMIQTGGTNLASLRIGYYAGIGSYTLSNGVSLPSGIVVGASGYARQTAGTQAVSATLTTYSDWIGRQVMGHGTYHLQGGTLSAAAINLGGLYRQEGGIATVSGEVNMTGVEAGLILADGELSTQATGVRAATSGSGGYRQTGGRHQVATRFTVARESWQSFNACRLEGGELLAAEIVLTPGAAFTKTGGTLNESGLVTMDDALIIAGTGTHRFGRLSLQSTAAVTNSILTLPTNQPVVLSFADSHQLPWASNAVLMVLNWAGFWTGGGMQQLYFGTDSAGLTGQQLGQVRFRDPAGFAPGAYPARILSTGELVPDALPPTGRTPPRLTLSPTGQVLVQLTLQGDASASYGIDVSSNLADWFRWTNLLTSAQGLATVADAAPATIVTRFYRAMLLP